MKKFLVTYLAPASVIEDWKKTEPEKRKGAEEKMQGEWRKWMSDHTTMFVDKGAGVGKTKRVTAQGMSDTKNASMFVCDRGGRVTRRGGKDFRRAPTLADPAILDRSHGDSSVVWDVKPKLAPGPRHFKEETNMSERRYPNESREYRDARDLLLKDEQELIDKVKSVAERRRKLPPGGQLKEDYVFQWANDGKIGKSVKFSELFADKNTLLLYSFMYGPS
jgi:Bacterial protein of unknown function (DUF899)